ncbi:MAG: flagellar protein FlaG [Mycobacterium leprae]
MKIDAKLISPVFAGRDPAEVKPDSVVALKTDDQQQVAVNGNGTNGKRTPAEMRRAELEQAAERLNETAKVFNRALQFKVVDRDRIVVKVVDTESGEIIREIPPESLVEAFKQVDKVLGLLIDQKV